MNYKDEILFLEHSMNAFKVTNDYYKNKKYKKLYQRFYYLKHGGKSTHKLKEEERREIAETIERIPKFEVKPGPILVSFN